MSGRNNKSGGRGRGRGRGGRSGSGARGGRGRGRNSSSSRSRGDSSIGRSGRGSGKARTDGRLQGRGRVVSAPPPKPAPSKLKNGEKGAEVHTVGEGDRIQLTRTLMELREDPDLEFLEFPPTLTNTERKFVHEISAQLGLVSKSSGKGENRRIRVTKRNEPRKKVNEDEIPHLCVGRKGIEAMRNHVKRFPPTRIEDLESHETGASLIDALDSAQNGDPENPDAALTTTLNQLGLGLPEAAPAPDLKPVKVDLDRRKRYHAEAQKRKVRHKDYATMQKMRSRLPVLSHQEEIVSTVANNMVTIVSADTGAGKSTQVPQFLLDANPTCKIVVTQPRRISAISIAERVAQEQCCDVGGLIGYQVRNESTNSKDTQLLFLTPGILIRRLQSSPELTEFNIIIIDEIHEKDRYTEFLLITLRDLLPRRPDLRVILMSATLQTEILVDYFSTVELGEPALIEIEGRTFPVDEFFLEDVLKMTGYIDASTAYDGGAMTSDQLETELSRLTVDQTYKCTLCGRTDFDDGVDLGIHMALCDGNAEAGDEHLEALEEELLLTAGGISGPNNTSGMAEDGIEFEEYDVDGKILLEENFDIDSLVVPKQKDEEVGDSQSEAKSEESSQKWDGKSPFKAVTSSAPGSESKDDELLAQYQADHDDESVDMYLLLEVLQYIIKSSYGDGAILVFLPGWQDISEFSLLLQNTPPFRNQSKYRILPLHSGIPSKDQRKVLLVPPKGVRKIIISTNIAETSLTVEDVAFVVDSGRAKEKSYDPHLKTSTLQPNWISRASSKQRKGRAGRTKAGVCFHLFSRRRYESMRPHVESELLRTPLEEMCLMCKKLGLAPGGPDGEDGIPAFLAKAMSPPHPKSISNALSLLVDLGAMIPETNDLTSLGQCLSVLSLEPRVGKMIIWSYLLGCAKATQNMAVAMSYKSPFILPMPFMRKSADEAKLELSKNSESDQITILNALQKKDELKHFGTYNSFCQQYFLGSNTLQMIADLRLNLKNELTSLGFPDPSMAKQYHNRHNKDHALWQAAIAAGLYPNVASRRRGDVNFSTMSNQKAKIHVSSVNALKGQPLSMKSRVPDGEIEFVCFGQMIKGNRIFTVEQTTHLVSPLPLLLLCGTSLGVMPDPGDNKTAILNVDDWIVFRCEADTAAYIVILRKRLQSSFLHLVADPSAGLTNLTDSEKDAVEIMGTVLQSAHRSSSSR